jgi:glycosyltransferase involved in cell wall biosynthesis
MEYLFITVVMPVRNEEKFIARTITQLLDQDYPSDSYEIIVADGMSDDKTRVVVSSISESYPQVKLMDNPGRLSSSGRNVGFRNGKGSVFMVVDGHCYIPTRDLFKNIMDCYNRTNADCLCRPQPLDPPDITRFQHAVALARGSLIGHGSDSLIYSDNDGYVSPVSHGAIYTRSVFDKAGYVDETFDACEDVEFNYRVEKSGFVSYMSPALTVKYYPRDSLRTLFKQAKRYGSGRFRFIKKHPEAFTLACIVPFAFVTFMIIFSILSLTHPFFGKLMGLVLCLYLFIISLSSLVICFKVKKNIFRDLFFIYAAVHFGLGWGFLLEMFIYYTSHLKKKILAWNQGVSGL